MTETVKGRPSLTRRSFLKTTAVAAGAVALAGSVGCSTVAPTEPKLPTTTAEKTYINMCRGNCGEKCPLEATVREGKVVRTTPLAAPSDERGTQMGCIKGQTNPQRIYATNRVLYPMKQTGERGSDNWERITWDEATSLIAEKFQTAIDDYGASSIAFWHQFGNSYGYLNGFGSSVAFPNSSRVNMGCGIAVERFLQKTGATVFTASSDFAMMYSAFNIMQIPLNGYEDLQYSKTIFIWGMNPTDANRAAWPWICKARDSGAKIITIDPRYSQAAGHSDIWVPVRPGTDGALALAMCNYIIETDLIDYEYLTNKSVAPLLLKEDGSYLRLSDIGKPPALGPMDLATGQQVEADTEVVYDKSVSDFVSSWQAVEPELIGSWEVNGMKVRTAYDVTLENIKPYTVEFAADECNVPQEQIVELAEAYANNKPAALFSGFGLEHHINSRHIYRDFALLYSLTGNAQKQGAMACSFGANSTWAKSPVNKDDSDLVIAGAIPSKAITGEYVAEIMETGKWAGEDFPVRCLYIMASNPLSHCLGRTALIEAFNKIDFVVVADSFLTDSARYASLVLPIALSWETQDHNGTFMVQKAVEPAGECRNDLGAFREIAEKMGYADLYTKTDEEYLRTALDTPENIAAGCAYDDYNEQGAIKEYTYAETVGVEYNATGRSQFYVENIIPRDDFGQTIEFKEHIPYYEHAFEAYKDNPLQEKYPLYGNSFHSIYHAHALHNHLPWLDDLRGEPNVQIHENAAQARGISTGDLVRVFNDHGSVVLKALVTKGVQEETVVVPHGPESDYFIEGHPQSLTAMCLDVTTSNNNLNDWLCQVELYEGGAQ